MKQGLQSMKNLLELPWTYSAFSIFAILLFPEYFAPIFAVISLIFAYESAKKSKGALKVGTNGILIWIYILGGIASIIYSVSRLSTLATFLMWTIMFCVYISLKTILTSRRRLYQFLVLLSIAIGLMGFIGIIQYICVRYFHLPNSALQFWGWLDHIVYANFPINVHLFSFDSRVSSTFTNPNMFAMCAVILLPFVSGTLQKSKRTYISRTCLVCLILGTLGILLTMSRASYICLMAIAVFFFIFNPANLKKKPYIISMLSFLVVIALLIVLPNIFNERMHTLHTGDRSINERIYIWEHITSAIKTHPFIGYGFGAQSPAQIMADTAMPNVAHSHNLYLELLVEGGFIALITFGLCVGHMLYRHSRFVILYRKNKALNFACATSVFCFLLFGLMDYPLLTPKMVATFFVMIALGDIVDSFSPDPKLHKLTTKE